MIRSWIGLTDMASEHGFVWMDGTTVDFTAWQPGQPDEFGGDFLTLEDQGERGHCDSFWDCPSGSSEGEDAVQMGFEGMAQGGALFALFQSSFARSILARFGCDFG